MITCRLVFADRHAAHPLLTTVSHLLVATAPDDAELSMQAGYTQMGDGKEHDGKTSCSTNTLHRAKQGETLILSHLPTIVFHYFHKVLPSGPAHMLPGRCDCDGMVILGHFFL
jgi:hypothetical protein